ncbi:bifunctional glycosyltransferase/CDP-glycerol:glycerophosphate glycerophosphotransferase [Streptomyces gobiensis]|uniref:bifunctional glycosyltransferase/CDP-glycerol:glycerophosphate glycerophosphotransferase n=1 Tax=Streptomyces gobiensis TaxID=2875706 RepID=UPI001E365635|nr:bifunctional glycosyltransferase/CDP-glycerol:glycerophosphate glycerophosphotransferase [Streptomyces gobiensis]UGY91726.1 CDP-glycerol glycerophosphotransferase family protein [Streptomyces gobiensis]
MPRFSIIVPAHHVQAYLPECLDSVLTQSFTDLELIAVDDHSPDACGEILDEAAAADPRVTVLHLPANAGPGLARNAGMARATGDYLLFLDSDDTLAPGALQAIADRLFDTAEPDVLAFGHVRTFWHGGSDRGGRVGPLAQRDPQVFQLKDRPALLRLPPVVWNKAYRREFIEEHGFAFSPGAYEGTPWTWCTLLTAEAVTVLDRVCVLHRQRRQGGLLAAQSRRHFDVFAQYDRVFAFLEDRPELACWQAVLYRRMTDHLTAVFLAPGELPRSCRAEFFRRSSKQCLRHQSAAGRTSLRHLLVRLGARRTFQLLWAVAGLRRRIRDVGRSLRSAALRLHYRLQCHRRLDPALAVFSSPGREGYTGDPAAIEAKARELVPGLRTAWVADPEHADTLPHGVRPLHPGSAAYWTALARATYLVTDGEGEPGLRKRPGQTLLQTHRGTPLGRMGLDLQDHPVTVADLDVPGLLERIDTWDYSLSGNRHSTLAWERAYPGGYTTLEYGAPRNDVFHTATASDVARVRAELGIPEGTTAILYAPVHRDYLRGGRSVGLAGLNPRRLARALGPGFVVLDAAAHRSLARLCLAADALITDYAPVMFDYANLDRPIVIHAEDWETYRTTRGTYFDLPSAPPGPVAQDLQTLVSIFRSGAWRAPGASALRAAFRARFCPYDDGFAADRAVRAIFMDGAGLAPVVPLELRRPAPSRPRGRGRVIPPAQPRAGVRQPVRM